MLLGQTDIRQVAGNDDVVGTLQVHVSDNPIEHVPAVGRAACAAPVGVAERSLKVPISRGEAGDVIGDAAQPGGFALAFGSAGGKQCGIVAIGGSKAGDDPLRLVADRDQRRAVVQPVIEQALQLPLIGGQLV